MIRSKSNSPDLSFVVTTRNDNHGGELLKRMQLCFNCIFTLAERHKLVCELVVVEWNPPADKPGLATSLSWPKSHDYCTVRIIDVPYLVHKKFRHSDNLLLYQMIGKNVGIRRSRGRMVLSTNIDILFTDALFEFFASGEMEEGKFYRTDRYDTDGDIDVEDDINTQLATAITSTLRVGQRGGTWNSRHGKYDVLIDGFADSGDNFPLFYPLQINACGDFTLMARRNWFETRGYWETDAYSFHLDSILCFTAHYAGIDEEFLASPMRIHHMEHESGWTPEIEAAGTLNNRLKSAGIPKLSNAEMSSICMAMSKTSRPLNCPNDDDWGLAAEDLTEKILVRASWEEQFGKSDVSFFSIPQKSLPLFPAKTGLVDVVNSDEGPYVSFVASIHDHDIVTIQDMINGLADRCDRYGLKAELIAVQWNRPDELSNFQENLKIPAGTQNLEVIVVEVPPDEHCRLRNGERVSHFDLIGKNTAARRARGNFIAVIDPDQTVPDQMIQFINLRRLDSECAYSINGSGGALKIDFADLSDDALIKHLEVVNNSAQVSDFVILSRENWNSLRGYPEVAMSSSNVANLLIDMAHASGMTLIKICGLWSIDVKEGSVGDIPDDLSLDDISLWSQQMMFERQPVTPNRDNWGLGDVKLRMSKLTATRASEIADVTSVERKPSHGPLDNYCRKLDLQNKKSGLLYSDQISPRTMEVLLQLSDNFKSAQLIKFNGQPGFSIAEESRTLFYVRLRDIKDKQMFEEVFGRLVPLLTAGSTVIIDDLWLSPVRLNGNIVHPYFANNVVHDIDPTMCFDGSYGPYWQGGSLFGRGEVIEFASWINGLGLELSLPSKSTIGYFDPAQITDAYQAFESEELTGSYFYNPADTWAKVGEFEDPSIRRIRSFCEKGAGAYRNDDISAATNFFDVAMGLNSQIMSLSNDTLLEAQSFLAIGMLREAVECYDNWKAELRQFAYFNGIERIAVYCQLRLGNIERALSIGNTINHPCGLTPTFLNLIRKRHIETSPAYSARA